MSSFLFGNTTQPTSAFSGFAFGAPTSNSTPNLAAPSMPGIGTNPIGASAPFGGLGVTTTTSAPSLFTPSTTPFSSSLFPSATTTTAAFPALGQAVTSVAPAAGFSFGGFGAPAAPTSNALSFGVGSTLVAATSTAPSTIGLGGIDIQTSTGLNGTNPTSKKDGKAIKENMVPNEIAVTVESLKKYVKEQKATREEMSRVSSKNIFRVQEQVAALRQQLSLVSNGIQRNSITVSKLKEESNQELKHAEIAQRTKDSSSSLQYENNAPTEYFHNLANMFERQMQSYRQQIEQLERHLLSLSQPYTLTPNEWTAIRQRLHDTFVTLAAQLQTIHQQVQVYREHFINTHRLNHADVRNLFESRKDSAKESTSTYHAPLSVSYGPSPFATMQSAVGKAITNVFNRTQQLPTYGGGTAVGALGSLGFEKSAVMRSSYQYPSNTSLLHSTSFKPLGQSGVPSLASSSLGDATGFASDSIAQSQFALNSQKPFQLQKPPAGNKRGKRWTST